MRNPFAQSILDQIEIVDLISEIGRVLEPGGEGVIIDWHPYNEASWRMDFANEDESSNGKGLEKYFQAFHEGGFIARHVKEAFVDVSFRKLMGSGSEKKWYERNRNRPFAIAFFVKKRKK